jgi:uncharacterized protein YjbI with pentapeptide repeats
VPETRNQLMAKCDKADFRNCRLDGADLRGISLIDAKATANNERVGWIAARCKPGGADSGVSRRRVSSPYG